MDWILVLAAVSIFAVGMCVGGLVVRRRMEPKTAGTLVVDRSDPDDGPYMFVELAGTTVNDISKNEFVLFSVENRNYLSQ